MRRSRARAIIGAGILAMAVEMIVGVPWFISWPLLMVGLFLLVWGVAPASVMRSVAALPKGKYLTESLDGFDRWIEGAAGPRESLDRLGHMMEQGLKILNRPVKSDDEFTTWKRDDDDWTNDVFLEIETNFSKSQAITYRSVVSVLAADMPPSFNSEHNTRKLHLNKKIENLRYFIDTQSNKL